MRVEARRLLTFPILCTGLTLDREPKSSGVGVIVTRFVRFNLSILILASFTPVNARTYVREGCIAWAKFSHTI